MKGICSILHHHDWLKMGNLFFLCRLRKSILIETLFNSMDNYSSLWNEYTMQKYKTYKRSRSNRASTISYPKIANAYQSMGTIMYTYTHNYTHTHMRKEKGPSVYFITAIATATATTTMKWTWFGVDTNHPSVNEKYSTFQTEKQWSKNIKTIFSKLLLKFQTNRTQINIQYLQLTNLRELTNRNHNATIVWFCFLLPYEQYLWKWFDYLYHKNWFDNVLQLNQNIRRHLKLRIWLFWLKDGKIYQWIEEYIFKKKQQTHNSHTRRTEFTPETELNWIFANESALSWMNNE